MTNDTDVEEENPMATELIAKDRAASSDARGGRRWRRSPPPVLSPGSHHRKHNVLKRMRKERSAYLFLAPGMLIFSLFTVFALLFAFYLTFHEWSILEPDKPFVGLDNYARLGSDDTFLRSVLNTFYFTGASVPLSMIVGLSLALLLNQAIRARGFFRAVFFLPQVTPFVVVAIIWKWLYNGDFGLINYYLLEFGIIREPLLWLSDQNLAMPAVVMMSVWAGVGFSMVIYLAGLQGVPAELHEAAMVDGASAIQRFFHITIPQLAPTTLFLLVMGIIGSLQVFTQIFIMTRGGPVERTTTMVYYIYQAAFKFFDMGYASTLAFALFAMTMVFTMIQLRLYRKANV
jgi:multiple sugar transport system permease protein